MICAFVFACAKSSFSHDVAQNIRGSNFIFFTFGCFSLIKNDYCFCLDVAICDLVIDVKFLPDLQIILIALS